MITIIRFICYIAAGVGALLLMDNYRTISAYIAMSLWIVIVLSKLLFDDFSQIRRDIHVVGWMYYILFFSYLFFGSIHVKHIDTNHVALYSPLWHKIVEGEKIDTLKLRSQVECYYYSYSEDYEDFYFLYLKDSIHVYNRLTLILKIHKDRHSIIQQSYYGGVPVDLIKDADGQVYSLDGELVDDKWRPRIHDTTPIDNTNM